jgi:vitamin K-dependent gamma-carboxylase
MKENTPWFYLLFPGTLGVARGMHAVMLLSSIAVLAGFYTRTASVVLLITWAAFVDVIPYADRGIDTLSRHALILLAVSPAGRTWSVDSWRATGSWLGDGSAWPAFARRLLVFQLVLMYFVAGVSKVGLTWWPAGDFLALYYALQDPAVAAWDFSWLRTPPFYTFTQLGSAGTVLYQVTYPMVLLVKYWERFPGSAGRLGSFAVRWRLEWVWIATGGVFHLVLALTMTLGIFPWAMLALYPVWFAPDELRRLFRLPAPARQDSTGSGSGGGNVGGPG